MKYTRLYLKGFKPLATGGTNTLEVTNMEQIIVLTGENGTGKSSVLREMTPWPATRTEYLKDGMKQIEIVHEDSHYVLTSDFSKTWAHSFRKDDVELNPSGTMEVQVDLVEQHLGYTQMTDMLLSGQKKFSEMSRNDRKQLIMTTYPSDLSFVLEKHKNLCSKIRAANNQLKLMKEREIKIKSELMEENVLAEHMRIRNLLNEGALAIDKEIYALGRNIEPYKADPAYGRDDLTAERITQQIEHVRANYRDMVKSGYVPEDVSKLDKDIAVLDYRIAALCDSISKKEELAISLASDLDKYKDMMEQDAETMLRDYQNELESIRTQLSMCSTNDSVPVMSGEELELYRKEAKILRDRLESLLIGVPLWDDATVSKKEQERERLSYLIDDKTSQKRRMEISKRALEEKLGKYEDKTWPKDCTRPCRLRDAMAEIVSALNVEYDQLLKDISKTDDEIDKTSKCLDALNEECREQQAVLRERRNLEREFSRSPWGEYVLNGQCLVAAINSSVTEIWNRFLNVMRNSDNTIRRKSLMEREILVKCQIEALQTSNSPSRDILKEIVRKCTAQLNDLNETLGGERSQRTKFESRLTGLKYHRFLCKRLDEIEEEFDLAVQHLICVSTVELMESEIERLEGIKTSISERLRELDGIIVEQDRLKARLNDEVRPVVDELTANLYKWTEVEKVLSPVSGLPKKMIVMYINWIFWQANQYIAKIWNYPLELVYLEEKDDCDYTFKLMVNGENIVKDISICSKGQREIVDLALILAVATCRSYAGAYPLKLDEMSSGLSPDHNAKLYAFLGRLFSSDHIVQGFIVSHDPIINGGFDTAGYIALSNTGMPDGMCHVLSKRT